ncbi:MAG: DUF1223 domain-containing protein [Proteobacteria bacterium]|nr:DUF1223 domain-containing protein [Pseudomonadota bacterium]
MIVKLALTALGALAIGAGAYAASQSAPASTPHASQANGGLAVVELFTSQGCSSCPPANDNVAALADRKDVLALSFGVTYWDYLGWKDTFASPANTERQRTYDRALHGDGPFTPQVVVDGQADTVGVRKAEIEALIARERLAGGPTLSAAGDALKLGSAARPAQARPADVWLVRYDPRVVQVPIKRGENSGRTLPHRNVVRSLTRLGAWNGSSATLRLPPAPAGLSSAVLVQSPDGGPILAALKL